jgi:GT2 family glycosyltransferase
LGGVTVIICCYNGQNRLPATLEYLAKQKVHGFPWEVIVVDNNSTDGTAEAASKTWDRVGRGIPMRVLHEAEPGLRAARQRGMSFAAYDTFVFCDDDNWLGESYVATARDIMMAHHDVGAAGGLGIPRYEIDPPHWIDPFLENLAVGAQGERTGYVPDSRRFLYGAGLVVRKGAIEDVRASGLDSLLSGRLADALTSGEDTELSLQLLLLGWNLWYDERLVFHHYIPAERMTREYLQHLSLHIASGEVLCSLYRTCMEQRVLRRALRTRWLFNCVYTSLRIAALWTRRKLGRRGERRDFSLLMTASSLRGRLSRILQSRRALRRHYLDIRSIGEEYAGFPQKFRKLR